MKKYSSAAGRSPGDNENQQRNGDGQVREDVSEFGVEGFPHIGRWSGINVCYDARADEKVCGFPNLPRWIDYRRDPGICRSD
jgi:hypothetical protein